MKKQIMIFAVAAILSLGAAFTASAQHHDSGKFDHSPTAFLGLTDDQNKKIEAIHQDNRKNTLSINLQIEEKESHLKTLRFADKPDMNAINATVEEIGKLKIEREKIRETEFQDVRKVLTEDQRIKFDEMMSKFNPNGMGHHHGYKGKGHHDSDKKVGHESHHNANSKNGGCCGAKSDCKSSNSNNNKK